MRRTNSLPAVAMKVLVEQHKVAEVRVLIHLRIATVCRTVAFRVAGEDADDTSMNLLGDIGEVHVLPAASRTLDFQVVSVVLVEALEGLDEEEICCEPNRAPPVRVAAKHG